MRLTKPPATHRDKPWISYLRLRFTWCMALLLALCAPGWAQPIDNANLSGLALSQGTLSPAFNPGTISYTAEVRNAVSSITVTPTLDDAGATVTVNGSVAASGSPTDPIALNTGNNTIAVVVTAQDGITTQTYTVAMRRAPVLTLNPTQMNVSCYGGSNGVASVGAGGGTSPYTYLWSNGNNYSPSITGLLPGNYSVTVTDKLGDQGTLNYTITQPAAPLSSTGSQSNPIGSNNNGSASATPSGGTPAYTYVWSPSGGTAAIANNLAAGMYTVSIYDANSCLLTHNFTLVTQSPTVQSVTVPASGTYGAGNVLTFTVNYNASITVNTSGGTPSIPLTIGSTTRQAAYTGGSGTSALAFSYTVQPGDLDADGVTLGSGIALNGGTAISGGANANLLLVGLGSTTGVLVSAPSPQTITFHDPGPQSFGTTPTLTATSDAPLTPTFTSSTQSVCDITAGGVLTFHTVGTCTIHADQAGNGSYLPATQVSHSFAVVMTSAAGTVPGMAGTATATLTGGGADCTLQPADSRFEAATDEPPGLRALRGQFRFTATQCTGGPVTITLQYPEPLPEGVRFRKPDGAGGWFDPQDAATSLGLTLSLDRKTVAYTITDNGLGDADSTPGTIADPLLPVVPLALGGGAAGIPALSTWALALLSALVGGLGWRRRMLLKQ